MTLPDGWCGYLINLPERKDRLISAEQELSRVGWKLGPGGINLYSAKKFVDKGGFVTTSIRGAFDSHTQCLKDGERKGSPVLLVLEDDIAFVSSLPELLPSVISQLGAMSWDLCYLGHEHTGAIGRANSETTQVQLVPYTEEIIATHFYLVNRTILARLIDHLDRISAGTEADPEYCPMPVDGALNIFRRFNPDVKTFVAMPKLGWQRPSRSDISPGFVDQFRFAWSVTNVLRNLKHATSRWLRG